MRYIFFAKMKKGRFRIKLNKMRQEEKEKTLKESPHSLGRSSAARGSKRGKRRQIKSTFRFLLFTKSSPPLFILCLSRLRLTYHYFPVRKHPLSSSLGFVLLYILTVWKVLFSSGIQNEGKKNKKTASAQTGRV